MEKGNLAQVLGVHNLEDDSSENPYKPCLGDID